MQSVLRPDGPSKHLDRTTPSMNGQDDQDVHSAEKKIRRPRLVLANSCIGHDTVPSPDPSRAASGLCAKVLACLHKHTHVCAYELHMCMREGGGEGASMRACERTCERAYVRAYVRAWVACVRAWVACAHACVCACVRACVRSCVRACVCAWVACRGIYIYVRPFACLCVSRLHACASMLFSILCVCGRRPMCTNAPHMGWAVFTHLCQYVQATMMVGRARGLCTTLGRPVNRQVQHSSCLGLTECWTRRLQHATRLSNDVHSGDPHLGTCIGPCKLE
jgi:hypothetical protein